MTPNQLPTDGATVLPDGSAFAVASLPLPTDHWLYAPHEYRDGEVEPVELPAPILNHQAHGETVRAAIRYAIRGATMCSKDVDFDPDALVQNAMYALCGPFGGNALAALAQQAQPQPAVPVVSDEQIDIVFEKMIGYVLLPKDARKAARAILALRPAVEPMTERWAVVRETVLDVGRGSDVRTGGRPELGYALISDAATFGSEADAVAAINSTGLPVGWVVMPLSRLLPDTFGITAKAEDAHQPTKEAEKP